MGGVGLADASLAAARATASASVPISVPIDPVELRWLNFQ